MKKIFYFLSMVFIFFVHGLFAVVEEGKIEPFKSGHEVKEPETSQEAGEFEKRYEETKKEIEDPEEYKKTTEGLKTEEKKVTGQKKIELRKEIQQRDEEYSAFKKAEGIAEKPTVKELIKKYQEELKSGYEPIAPDKPTEPKKVLTQEEKTEKLPFAKRMLEAVKSWVRKVGDTITRWFGDKKKVQKTSEAVTKTADTLGQVKGVNTEVATMVEILEKNLERDAQKINKLSPKATSNEVNEVVAVTVNDILQTEEAAKQLPQPINKQIESSIEAVKESLGVTPEDSSAMKKQATEQRKKDIQSSQSEINESMPKFKDMSLKERVAYIEKVEKLAKGNVSVLAPEEQGILHETTNEALAEVTKVAFQEATDVTKNDEVRGQAVAQILEVVPTQGETEAKIHETFKQLAQEGKEPEKKLNTLTGQQKEQMKSELNSTLKKVLAKIDAPEQAYEILKNRIDAMEKIIDVKDISIEKLEAQLNMASVQINVLKKFDPKKVPKQLVDNLFKIIETIQKIEINRSAMIEPDKEGNPVIVKEVPVAPPLPAEKLVAKKQEDSKRYEQKLKVEGKKPDAREQLFEQIRLGTNLKNVTIEPVEQPKKRDAQFKVFSKALEAMLEKGIEFTKEEEEEEGGEWGAPPG